ncbi:MAG: potassium channel family protein [Flavobacteriaceae bacterium]
MNRVNANSLFACISGYILLGIVSSMFFNLLNIYSHELSFNTDKNNFYDLLYYSFTTITSVGYGDIVPTTPLAKAITILVSISGQLYLTFLVGIIIGKYLGNESENSNKPSS